MSLTSRRHDAAAVTMLRQRLQSLDDHCLVSLGDGLEAMTRGDLTRAAQPVTEPIAADDGRRIGSLGETFNTMLGRAQGGLGAYNTMREQLAAMIAEIGSTSTAVAGASEQISSTAAQTGAAVQEIARPPSTSPPAPSAR
jgi:methyl-accepting chemotaxis protein